MTADVAETVDERTIDEFAGRLFGLYTSGLLTYMIDIGHRTGLFQAAALGPATSGELAARAGLQERYVREWAAALATGHVLTYDAPSHRYRLPAAHAACLTGSGAMNLAPGSQLCTLLAPHVAAVARAFREGGGVPYSAFRPDFTSVMDALGRGTYDELLLDGFLPLTGELPQRLAAGIRVADIGCGTGHCVNLMAAAYPASQLVGYDLADDAIARARGEASALGLSNVSFDVLDVADLPRDPGFGAVFAFDAIHDQADPDAVLRRVQEALVPGGWFVMVDTKASSNVEDNVGNPLAPLLYSISTLHCLTVSLAAGGAGLGTAWGQQLAEQMLADAGFVDVDVQDAPGDPLDLVYVCRTAAT
jgi:SAM-dependent methyltransferase